MRGFVGGDADTATGFTNLGARENNPQTQSFLSPDALVNPGDPQDLNAYASDSPAAFSDPSGMFWSVTVLAVATSPAAVAAARAAGMAAAVRAAGTGTAAGFRRPHRSLG